MHLLVSDDEPMIADLVQRILTARANLARVACHPRDALEIWAEGLELDTAVSLAARAARVLKALPLAPPITASLAALRGSARDV